MWASLLKTTTHNTLPAQGLLGTANFVSRSFPCWALACQPPQIKHRHHHARPVLWDENDYYWYWYILEDIFSFFLAKHLRTRYFWLQLITLLLWYSQWELWLTLIPKASHSRVYFGEGFLYKHSVLYAVQTRLIRDLCYWVIWINSIFPCKTPKWMPEAGGPQSRSWREGGHRCIEMTSTQTIFLIWHTRYITLLSQLQLRTECIQFSLY